ncbi:N-acetylmuramoyl-L-alanine amidase [Micromonospora sp. Llam0]|uniref:peptidoglycan recognition protein family protein n=1 Tax=Micromonospora sp. Llam0 TaxID=2485143 RepID=UPI000FAE300B|nr:N-acetylmuramoyl-L-alanine amidase [Micromonospora sp. Llam0]ROO51472.1 N-acetylmuramoyl-L-alanine amidase [Micromonospora sp. Llam0]
MRLLWLPEVLRSAGLTVREVDGWRDRGSSSWGPIRGVICHATAGGTGARAEDEVRVLLNGSATAPPPIAQTYLARDGVWWVVASGRCNHALTGWAGPCKGLGNAELFGVEAGNNNRGEPWPQVQLDSYQRGVAAISGRLQVAARMVAAHREHQPWPPPKGQTSTKSDPHGIDMTQFRARVDALQRRDATMAISKDDVREIAVAVNGWIYPKNGPALHTAARNAAADAARAVGDIAALRAELRTAVGRDWVDEDAIVSGVLTGLGARPPEEAATALVAVLGEERAAALGRALLATN